MKEHSVKIITKGYNAEITSNEDMLTWLFDV